MAYAISCAHCGKSFPSHANLAAHDEIKCFNRQERAMKKRNLEKQALAGAKAMVIANARGYIKYDDGRLWPHLSKEAQAGWIKCARACINAVNKVRIEI